MRKILAFILLIGVAQSCTQKKNRDRQLSTTVVCNKYLISHALTLWKKMVDNEPGTDSAILYSNRLANLLAGLNSGENPSTQNPSLVQFFFFYGNGRQASEYDQEFEMIRDKSILKGDSILVKKKLIITDSATNNKYVIGIDFQLRRFSYKHHTATVIERIFFDHPLLASELIGMPSVKYAYEVDTKNLTILNQVRASVTIFLHGRKKGISSNLSLRVELEDFRVLDDQSVSQKRTDKEMESYMQLLWTNVNWSDFKENLSVSFQ